MSSSCAEPMNRVGGGRNSFEVSGMWQGQGEQQEEAGRAGRSPLSRCHSAEGEDDKTGFLTPAACMPLCPCIILALQKCTINVM